MQPVDLITVSREFGAGGSELAAALGARLGWRVLDGEIADAVARRLGVELADIAARDEHPPGILERFGTVVLQTSPEFAPSADLLRTPEPDDIAEATRALLVEEAQSPPLIIVGHAAQALFQDRPDALHLRLVAPLAVRLRRICRRAGCTDEDATRLAHQMDGDRHGYIRRYYHRDWHDPLLYHLQLNTGAITIAEAERLVVALLEARRSGVAHPASEIHDA